MHMKTIRILLIISVVLITGTWAQAAGPESKMPTVTTDFSYGAATTSFASGESVIWYWPEKND